MHEGIGAAAPRTEDARLVTGRATWTGNLHPTGTAHCVFVRSPVAHARVSPVDTRAARGAPGVLAALAGRDLAALCPEMPCLFPEEPNPPYPLVAVDEVRYAGEPIAVVVARTEALARDAAELVTADYDDLPVVVGPDAALAADAGQVHAALGTNVVFDESRHAGDVDTVVAAADVVVRRRFTQPRVVPGAMEPRAVLAAPAGDGFTLWSSTQMPHILRHVLALGTGIPKERLRVVAPDVGGAFGGKFCYPEDVVVLLLARQLARPVAWTATRSEDLQTTYHGRALSQQVTLAARRDGRLTALDVDLVSDIGAYVTAMGAGSAVGGMRMYPGIYRMDAYRVRCRGVLTNAPPVGAYRGAGRPEATFAIERVVDEMAAELGMDPVELRRQNWHPEFPARSVSGHVYDVGDFAATTSRMLALVDYAAVRRDQAERRRRNSPVELGIGVSTYVEVCGGGVRYDDTAAETASVRLTPDGDAEVVMGTSPFGTGHATSWAQVVADTLSIPVARVRVVHGDTEQAPHGYGSYGSRSLVVVGSALVAAAREVLDNARQSAAQLLECSPADLHYEGGVFTVTGTSVSRTLTDVAAASYRGAMGAVGEPGLGCVRGTDLGIKTYPFGAHVAVVEVDADTGHVRLVRYVAVDDVGNVVNPVIVQGQVHGGSAQGIAQAMFEEAGYDELGNPLAVELGGYGLPAAPDLPPLVTDRCVTPTAVNPFGAKGAGETGAIAAPPAVVNAVLDAVRHRGVRDVPMPMTPFRVWRALRSAAGAAANGPADESPVDRGAADETPVGAQASE